MLAKLCVAIACSTCVRGVRRDYKVDKPSVLVEGVGALLQEDAKYRNNRQMMDILDKASRAVSDITPGAKVAMNDALNSVITEITGKVESQIHEGHSATNAAIARAVEHLSTTTKTAVETKTEADNADTSLVTCMVEERDIAQNHDAAVVAEDQARQNMTTLCTDLPAAFSHTIPPEDLVFTCDISLKGNCDADLAAFRAKINGILADLRKAVEDHTNTYNKAKGLCDSATDTHNKAVQTVADLKSSWNNKRLDCLMAHERRQVGVCVFGLNLHSKCRALDAMHDLDRKIDGTGEMESDSERRAEFETISVTVCMLKKIIEADDLTVVELNGDTINTCREGVDYDTSVGTLSRQQAQVANLTEPESFSCAETEITFSNSWWVRSPVLEGEVASAGDYSLTSPFAEEVDTAVSPMFDFCAESTQSCGKSGIECDMPDPKFMCHLASGCTSGECCTA